MYFRRLRMGGLFALGGAFGGKADVPSPPTNVGK